MSVTIKDVAKLAGVSPSTVSRTCTNSPLISEKTQERVRQAMAELGYQPPASPSTAVRSIRSLGVILPPSTNHTFENTFFLEILRGISQYALSHSCSASIITGKDEQEILETIDRLHKARAIDSCIVLFSKKEDPVLEFLYSSGIDFTLVGSPQTHRHEVVSVDNDNIAACLRACEYLIERGHRKIAFVGSPQKEVYSRARRSGYILALTSAGIPLDPAFNIEADLLDPASHRTIADLLSLPERQRPTAMVVSDDLYALLIKHLCNELGLRIPQDLSLISFNNSITAAMSYPPLTSIDVNALQLGMEAATQAINRLDNPEMMPSKILVPYSLVERESVQDLRHPK